MNTPERAPSLVPSSSILSAAIVDPTSITPPRILEAAPEAPKRMNRVVHSGTPSGKRRKKNVQQPESSRPTCAFRLEVLEKLIANPRKGPHNVHWAAKELQCTRFAISKFRDPIKMDHLRSFCARNPELAQTARSMKEPSEQTQQVCHVSNGELHCAGRSQVGGVDAPCRRNG